MDRIKVLAVAPYPGLVTVLEGVTPDYPDIDLTIHLGDLESGLNAAHAAFSENFDAVISRGGTAQVLEEELSVPVVEIELSTVDILRQTQSIPVEGPRLAAVGFGNAFAKLKSASDLLPRPVDVRTVDFADEVPLALDALVASGHVTFLCDNVAFETARKRGLDARLLISGPDSVRQALDRVLFYFAQWREGMARNRLLWQIIQNQPGNIVLYYEGGRLVYSDLPEKQGWILGEIEARFAEGSERMVFQRAHRIWRVRRSTIQGDGTRYVEFLVTSSREPVRGGMAGIEYLGKDEVERGLAESVFRAAGAEALVSGQVAAAVRSRRPVMLRGEVGCGKDQIVKMLYLAGDRTGRPYVSVDCSLLIERSFEFLTESYTSPLYESGQTLCLKSIHALSLDRWHELLAVIRQTGICDRNFVLLSGNDREDGSEPDSLATFAEQLHCHVLTVAPLRARPDGVAPAVLGYLAHASREAGRKPPTMDDDALRELEELPWPRNYLQLRKVIDWLLATCHDGRITVVGVREALARERTTRFSSTSTPSEGSTLDLLRPLADIERDVARIVLESCNGNKSRAAKTLGISRTTMWRLLK